MSEPKRSAWSRINRKATEEEKSRKRAAEQARRLGPGKLNADEEEFAIHVRSQLANIGGYFYRPDYQHTDLRTEPPCQEPEYSEYDLKKMREARLEQRRRKKAAGGGSADKTKEGAGDAKTEEAGVGKTTEASGADTGKVDMDKTTEDVGETDTDKPDISTNAASEEKADDFDSHSTVSQKLARRKANRRCCLFVVEPPDTTAGARDDAAVPDIKVEDSADESEHEAPTSTAKRVDKFAESVMPNIARLSMIMDSDDSEDEDDDGTPVPSAVPDCLKRSMSSATKLSVASDLTVTRLNLGKRTASDNASIRTTGSDKTVIRHGGSKPGSPSKTDSDHLAAAREDSTTNSGSHSPSPIRFFGPPRPTNYENPSPTETPEVELRPDDQHAGKDEEPVADEGKMADNADPDGIVNPWPDLWAEYEHKGPQMTEKNWSMVNACLGPLGMPEYGRIQPADPMNRAAYEKVVEILKTCWAIMTGQLSAEGNDVASQILEPMLEKERLEKQERLDRLLEKLKVHKKALHVSATSSKHSSASSEMQSPMTASAGASFPSFGDIFTDSPVSAPHSKRSSAASQNVQPHENRYSGASVSSNSGQSAHSSVHSVDALMSPQTPSSKRAGVPSFTNLFGKVSKAPKMPKSPAKSHRKKHSIEEHDLVVTTPLDAPPMPSIPATYGAADTQHFPFDAPVMGNRNAPHPVDGPVMSHKTPAPVDGPQIRKKRSMGFGDLGRNATHPVEGPQMRKKKSMTFGDDSSKNAPKRGLGKKSSMLFGDVLKGGKKKTPQASDGTPLQIQVPADGAHDPPFSGPLGSDSKTPTAELPLPSARPDKLTVDTSVPPTHPSGPHKHTRQRSTASSITPSDPNVFDAHIDELARAFRAWDTNTSPTDSNESPNTPLDASAIDALSPSALAALSPAVLQKAIAAHSLATKYPWAVPPAPSFPLPHLALRLATHLLSTLNAAYLPLLDCSYEIYNAKLLARERLWRFRHPLAVHYPGPGIPRPTPDDYLEAGYLVAWCTRFVQWAQGWQQVWVWKAVDGPGGRVPGGGLKKPGRTMEVRGLLNWVDERVVVVDGETGGVGWEGEGGACSVKEVEARFEEWVDGRRGEERQWGRCEEQVRKMVGGMAG